MSGSLFPARAPSLADCTRLSGSLAFWAHYFKDADWAIGMLFIVCWYPEFMGNKLSTAAPVPFVYLQFRWLKGAGSFHECLQTWTVSLKNTPNKNPCVIFVLYFFVLNLKLEKRYHVEAGCWGSRQHSRRTDPCAVVAETSNQETKHHSWRAGELRFMMPAGPEELTL